VNLDMYDNCWCAVQVTPRYEVITSTILRTKDYEQFLPMYKSKRQWSDRVKEIESPLFTGYVFCKLNSRNPWSIVTTPGVIRIVGTRKEIAVIDEREIEAIQLAVKSGVKVEPCAYARVGDRVRITSGPLSGLEGIVMSCKNRQRLVLSVNLIQSSVSVEVDGCNLEPVTKPSEVASSSPMSVPHAGMIHALEPIPLVG